MCRQESDLWHKHIKSRDCGVLHSMSPLIEISAGLFTGNLQTLHREDSWKSIQGYKSKSILVLWENGTTEISVSDNKMLITKYRKKGFIILTCMV